MKISNIILSVALLAVATSFYGCVKNKQVGNFTVKGYIINSSTNLPESNFECIIRYAQESGLTSGLSEESGAGITDENGYFEFPCKLYRLNGDYYFSSFSDDLQSDFNKGHDFENGKVYDLDTLYY